MSLKTLPVLAALATLAIAAPTMAQPKEPADVSTNDPALQPQAPADETTTTTMTTTETTAAMPSQSPVTILQSSPTPADQAYKLVAGAPDTVSNAPIPDTLENRAKYGGPMSHGGRKTAPRGN